MRIGVLGINHKLADLKLRESFAKACHQRFDSLKSPHLNQTIVLLSTCNRTEAYFSSRDLAHSHSYIINILRQDLQNIAEDFDQKLYSYFGHDCFKHLARVTAGLDSAIVAETEIQGQVKAAYENASKVLDLPCEMHFLFQKSLKIGKQIRTELPLGRGIPDLEHTILNIGLHSFSDLENAKILFVGASDINKKILSFLKNRRFKNLSICNRSLEAANLVAQRFQINLFEWEKIDLWSNFDIAIFGTKSPEYLISKTDFLKQTKSQKLVIDLSVPRNVDPKIGRAPNVTLLNIDQINRFLKTRRLHLLDLLVKAEDIVHLLTKKQIELFSQKEKAREQLLEAS